MISNMAVSLIMHKRISTTTAKAKALKTFVEPLITKSKDDSTHSRRVVFGYLKDKEAVSELFRTVSPKIAERPGGYTRILKTGNRIGDNAEMCIIELVDFNELMKGGEAAKPKTARRRRSGKKTAEVPAEAQAKTSAPKAKETVKAEKTPKPEAKAEDESSESTPETETKE
jgi:large subunit ribosomal protein L17